MVSKQSGEPISLAEKRREHLKKKGVQSGSRPRVQQSFKL